MKLKLQTKLILLIGSLLLLVIIVLALSFQRMWVNSLKEHIGATALNIAKTVARMPEIQEAFDDPDPARLINPIIEPIREETGAEFIVVGNREGIRYSHPDPLRIGKTMVGGDNGPVFEGRSITSVAAGSLGLSLRGKTPIFDDNNQVIGVVSVGFLLEDINEKAEDYRDTVLLISLVTLAGGAAGAILIARGVKKSILGLEPEEIGHLYQEKKAVLESIREGILAVNRAGTITLANQTALQLLGVPEHENVTGRYMLDVLPTSRLMEVVESGRAEFDQEMVLAGEAVVVNRVPVLDDENRVIGAVASFRARSELYRLNEELAQVKLYAGGLRAQTHEYSNKLYTISGLIQLGLYQEALEVITHETDVHQNFIRFIMEEIPSRLIGGLLVGKFNRANELRVELVVDPDSTFRDIPAAINRFHLVTILGNLIDNAMDAVLEQEEGQRRVTVLLTDLGEDLIMEVEDTGKGIPDEVAERIFETGFSTKNGESRGVGLALVRQAVDQLGGYITFARGEQGGTVFTAVVPKQGRGRPA
ncbi:sensor histidine kinase [Paenibacillus sp. J31TS4]|uniref:ATP-binding protein n=1 Tax=Paenibacillus sp. J31TS4 TaxID=2807195 RepID=UPI001B0D627F|nr:sensor histidine kinase [Paenibacillus sp. J31TS4]GIP40226.1 sensor histidine kinase [Paenibacillus sp. J31TS4]